MIVVKPRVSSTEGEHRLLLQVAGTVGWTLAAVALVTLAHDLNAYSESGAYRAIQKSQPPKITVDEDSAGKLAGWPGPAAPDGVSCTKGDIGLALAVLVIGIGIIELLALSI